MPKRLYVIWARFHHCRLPFPSLPFHGHHLFRRGGFRRRVVVGGRREGCAGPGAQTTWWFELTWQCGTNKCTHIKKNVWLADHACACYCSSRHHVYTVQRQGLAPLALGSARPDPTRARVRARCWCLGPALIGSRAKTSDLARPCLRVGIASLPQEIFFFFFHSY